MKKSIENFTKHSYNCISIPVRMFGKTPQIKIRGIWLDFPYKKEFRPKVDKFYSMPVAGISATWKNNTQISDESLTGDETL